MPTLKQIGKSITMMGVDRQGNPLPALRRRCPFCGGAAQWKAPRIPSAKFFYAVECRACLASTTFYRRADGAADRWNGRMS